MNYSCSDIMAEQLGSAEGSTEYRKEMEFIENSGIKTVCRGDDAYPGILKNIYAPPPVLFFRGEMLKSDANAVAIVGSRRCSLYGLRMAEKLAFELAERGVTIISGMARGIDTAAHHGALKAGGRTIAVMGSGFRHIYPPEAGKLLCRITENGAVLTEFVSSVQPNKWNFPKRNRIISGMAKGVVVVEASAKSGALITVGYALDQGKEVFAVPGMADTPASAGTNRLIKEGAKLVTGVEDIFEELDIEVREREKEKKDVRERDLTDDEEKVLSVLNKEGTVHVDRMIERAGMDRRCLPETLLRLEMKGVVRALPGKSYKLVRE